MHLKRKTIDNFWPIRRTGNKYLAVSSHNKKTSLPLLIVIRDVAKIVKTKKELKAVLQEKKITVNGKIVRDTNFAINLFDSIGIPSIKKYYRIVLNGKKFALEEINEKESTVRIYKVINKKILQNKVVQINLSDGRNILTKDKILVGDFVVVDNKDNKINKIISLKKDVSIIGLEGKHAGKEGKIIEVKKEGQNTLALVATDLGNIKVNIKNIFVKE